LRAQVLVLQRVRQASVQPLVKAQQQALRVRQV
jgi:hypothetical protein